MARFRSRRRSFGRRRGYRVRVRRARVRRIGYRM